MCVPGARCYVNIEMRSGARIMMERRGELALTYLSHSDHPTHSSIFRRSPGTTTSAGLRALRDWLEGGKDGGIAAGTQDLQSSHEEN